MHRNCSWNTCTWNKAGSSSKARPVRTPRERRAAQWRRVVSGVAVDARRLRRGAVMSGVRRCERRRALISGVDGVNGLDGRVHLDGTARAVVRVSL